MLDSMPPNATIKYASVPGYFAQDNPQTDASSFDYTSNNFGLLDRAYDTDKEFDPQQAKTQWQRFEHYVSKLNQEASSTVRYRVLFMGRHGEGFHNVANASYGDMDWNGFWSLLPGDGKSFWSDSHLTKLGIEQARTANRHWAKQLEHQKIPSPERYYVSPLARCLQTAFYTFDGLELPSDRPFVPLIKELLREEMGLHTCDMRSSKSWIAANYPSWPFEEGFAESDELWRHDHRESEFEIETRLHTVLQDILSKESHTFLSFTTHSGAIRTLLRCLGHRPFELNTGAVIVTLVKVEHV